MCTHRNQGGNYCPHGREMSCKHAYIHVKVLLSMGVAFYRHHALLDYLSSQGFTDTVAAFRKDADLVLNYHIRVCMYIYGHI